MNKAHPASHISLAFLDDWRALLSAQLTPETLIAPSDVDDADPGVFRQDERLDYAYINLGGRDNTHVVKLVVRSDDKQYRCFVEVYEFVGDAEKLVYQYEVIDPPTQTDVVKVATHINGKRCNFCISCSVLV